MTLRRLARKWALLTVGAGWLTACGDFTIVHERGEKEANDIVLRLWEADISATKMTVDTGRRIYYNIAVPSRRKQKALKVLQRHDYPRRIIAGYSIFEGSGGLIPTREEELAKKLYAIEGEIEKQLILVSGVLDAEINIVLPEESPLRTAEDARVPTTASVAVKYLPGPAGEKPLSESSIRSIVAAGVEKLTADHVVVVMTQASGTGGASGCPECSSGGTMFLSSMPEKVQKVIFTAAAILIVILGLAVAFGQIRLRNVRTRLIRLQTEIAKARRRTAGEIAATE